MKCIILAAGYATRLYPLTENFPKPLLDVGDKPIIQWILDDISKIPDIDEIIIVSNHKFLNHFLCWKDGVKYNKPIHIIDDGSTNNDNRLGAVKDIAFVIEKWNLNDDLFVLAGDNITDFSFCGFINYFKQLHNTCVMRHYESSIEKLQRTGVAIIDDTNRLRSMQEKPKAPASNWAVPPFYIYSKDDLKYIIEGVKNNLFNMDAPGSFVQWLCEHRPVYSYEMSGRRYNIGDLETYENVKMNYKDLSC